VAHVTHVTLVTLAKGLDCFLASDGVGPSGKVIGIDMTPDMLASARAKAKVTPL
jgi:ubiquinone/menaquinone biosynthesis C-methylase UbiE